MTHIQELFIANLRFYRVQNGFSQLSFSEAIDISPNYLNAVENGKNFPSLEVLQNITETLKIMPYQLFLEIPVMQNDFSSVSKQTLIELKQKICGLIDEELEKNDWKSSIIKSETHMFKNCLLLTINGLFGIAFNWDKNEKQEK